MKQIGKLGKIGTLVKSKHNSPSMVLKELSEARLRKKSPHPGLVPLSKAPMDIQLGAVMLATSNAQRNLFRLQNSTSHKTKLNPQTQTLNNSIQHINQAVSLLNAQQKRRLTAEESKQLYELRAKIVRERGTHKTLGIQDRHIRILLR